MNTFGSGGFGQNKPGGFNTPAAAGGFGQIGAPQQGGFGQPQQQQAGSFGQPAGGFGQQPPQQGGMFGQPPQQVGGLGSQPGQQAGGFGQPQPQQQQPNAFGQRPGVGGFGQPQPQASTFGQPQQQAGGFGQQQQVGGFGQQQQQPNAFGQPQQQVNAFGQMPQQKNVFDQPQQQQAGGFGQQTGGFGQPQQQQQQAGGFGQAAGGGFGAAGRGVGGFSLQPAAAGFGQQPQQQTGGFGPPQQSPGFGQPAAGSFGVAGRGAGGFGQQPATGGFGQQQNSFGAPQQTGFGAAQQPTTGGFGQVGTGTGFGTGRGATTGFGTAAGGGFGAPAQQTSGFGQATATGGFGQPSAAATGFGQPAAGSGFSAAGRGTGGFGQPSAAGTGFGQPVAGSFGVAGRGAGGFGQQPATGGFGQQQNSFGAPQQTGFGAAQQPTTGGFGQVGTGTGFGTGRGATTGFGTAAGGGFGAPAQQTSGFGQATATGGFGQPSAAATGFGQPAAATGFGQQPAGTGFGQPAAGAGGFGQQLQTAGGFGQPLAAGTGFGQPASATGFGQPAAGAGFGQQQQQPAAGAGGFGQAPLATGAAVPGGSLLNFGRPTDLSFMSLPDYNASPYGNVLLFDTYERPLAAKQSLKAPSNELGVIAPSSRRAIHTWLVGQMRVPEENTLMNQGPASLGSSALSPFALKEMLVPAVQLGVSDEADKTSSPAGIPQQSQLQSFPSSRPSSAPADAAGISAVAPQCSNPDFVLSPSLAELSTYAPDELRHVAHFCVRLRDGSCEIRFLDAVNLVRVDVGEVLHLSCDGRAVLYPSGVAPPPSSGLNVRAEVRVRDETGELKEKLLHHLRKVQGSFVGYRQGWCIYRLNDPSRTAADGVAKTTAAAPAAADTSGLHPLSIVRDDDEYSHTLNDTRDEWSERDADAEDSVGSFSEDEGRAAGNKLVAAAPLAAEIRQFTVPSGSRQAAVAERCLAAADAVDFELPYELPDMSTKSKIEPFEVKLGAARPSLEPRVYYVRAQVSVIQRTYVNHPGGLRGSERTVRGMLARSSRAGFSIAGTIAFGSHAELRDGAEANSAVPEVVGARAVTATPFHWHKPANKVLTQCAVAVLRLFLQHTEVAEEGGLDAAVCPHASINLHRNRSHNTLSVEKLMVAQKAVEDAATARGVSLTRVEALSTQQAVTVLSLLSALYALPEGDEALPNAVEESRYLRQLRHRNLAAWLKRELATFLDTTKTASLSPAEELVQIMLCHRLREARTSACWIANEELARVVRVCGEGNQFGGYVEMAKGGFKNGEEVRQRVVGLLSGKVEPFMTDDEYKGVDDSTAEVRAVPSAATWKQLLGIFTFYGCVPDTPAEDIIIAFLDRLRTPSPRKLNPLPPYAERVDAQTLRTKRGKDLVSRGNVFQDAALLLLEGFANGSAPPASCLHPHASSYDGTDYLTALLIVAAIRAIQLPREQTYKDAELSVLLGMAAQLECNDETWFWGLLPLHLIESATNRVDAVRGFCKRNAIRAAALKEQGGSTADFDRLLSLLRVDATWLDPVVAPAEEVRMAPENSPSVATHAALEKALTKLAL